MCGFICNICWRELQIQTYFKGKTHCEGHSEGGAALFLVKTNVESAGFGIWCPQVSGGRRRWACPRSWVWWRASWRPPWSPSATTTPALACRAHLLHPTTPLTGGLPWRPLAASWQRCGEPGTAPLPTARTSPLLASPKWALHLLSACQPLAQLHDQMLNLHYME